MRWTADTVRAVCKFMPEHVLEEAVGGWTGASRQAWTGIQTAQRLAWMYGPHLAARILSRSDATTRADIRAWNKLGKSKEAA